MVFGALPGPDQDVDIEQKLGGSLSKGLKILVSHSEGVVLVKCGTEDTLEELGDRKDGEEYYSDCKSS